MAKEKSMGNYGLKLEEWDYKRITLEDMIRYIDAIDDAEEREAEKKWFKSTALNEDGKYNHLKAKRAFCRKYIPSIIPVAKKKADILKDW